MKKITYMMVALAGLSLLACNKEQQNQPEPVVNEYTYTIAVDADTKAYLDGDHMTWQTGNQIGWFTDKAGSSEINMATDPRSFQVNSTAAMAAGATIYAYAPYKAGEQSKTEAPLSIPTAQDGIISDAMPMVSLPIALAADMAAATDTPAGQASFLGLGAIIEYNVYTTSGTYGTEKVQSVQFTSDSNIAGNFTVDLTTVAENAIPAPSGLNQKTVTSTLATATTVGDSKANGIKVYQVIAPGDFTGDVIVYTDKASYRFHISSAKTFTRGKIKPLNVDLKNGVRTPNPYEYWFSSGDFDITTDENYVAVHNGTFDGILWTLSFVSCNGGSCMFQWTGPDGWARNAIQCGYYNAGATREVTLSTNGFTGTITKLSIYYITNDDQDDVTASATVGGSSFGSPVAHVNEAWHADFTGNAKGEIVLRITATTTLWPVRIKGMYVEYEP